MSGGAFRDAILAELLRWLDPLRVAASDLQTVDDAATVMAFGLHEALTEMGLADRLPGDPMETLPPVAAAIQAATATIAASQGGGDPFGAAADVLMDVETVVDALRGLATPPPGVEPVPDPATPEEIAAALWGWLAWRRMRTASPAFEAIAEMLGVVVLPDDDDPLAWHPARLRALLGDPADTLRDSIGWGDQFDGERAIGTLETVAEALGLPVTPTLRATGLPDIPEELILRIRLAGGGAEAEAGLSISVDDPAAPTGLAIGAYGAGALSFDRVLLRRASLRLEIEAVAESLSRVFLRPDGLSVEPGGSTAGAQGTAMLEIGDPSGDPLVLLTLGPLGVIEAARVHVGLTMDAEEGTARLAGAVTGGLVTIAGGERDGFLSQVLPDEPIEAPFDLSLQFSAADGLTVEGTTGLEIEVPMATSLFGVASLNRLRLVGFPFEGPMIDIRAALSARLGPLSVVVDGIGLRAALGSPQDALLRLGPVGADLTVLPPTGIGLGLDLGALRGGGFLSVEPGRYAGALELSLGELALAAFGLVETRMPDGSDGFSMLLFVSGRFAPVQLGFGFTLLGVGGMLGVHRDLDQDALFAAVRAGTAGDLLSPEDPVRDAARLVALAEGIFPSRRGQYVFGPTVKLGWGTPTLLSLDLALAVTLPEPVRIVLIGRLSGAIPAPEFPIVRLTIDLSGVLDVSGGRLELQGRLHDSVIQMIPIEGGFALRSAWGGERHLLFSVGGLHPAFEPPPSFPDLPRMGTTLTKGGILKLTMGGYFAITSNTIQIGAAVDLRVSAAGFTLLGALGFDALVEFEPFRMQLDIHARVQVMRGRRSLFKLAFKGRLSGPNPWHVRGQAIIEVPILPDIKVGASATFGTARDLPSEAVDVLALMAEAVSKPDSWSGDGPPAGLIPAPGPSARVDPRGGVRLVQEVAPLGRDWAHFYGKTVSGAVRARLGVVTANGVALEETGPLTAPFPPGAFRDLSEADRLAAPGFADMPAGARLGGAASVASGAPVPKVETRETMVLGPRAAPDAPGAPAPPAIARAVPAAAPPVVRVRGEAWRATDRHGTPRGPGTDWAAADEAGEGAPILAAEAA